MASDLYEIRFSGELTTDRQPPVSCPRCDATRGLTVVGRAGGPGRVRHCGRTFDFPRGWGRLMARDEGRKVVAETPWLDIPDPKWTAEHTHHFETGATVHPSDHTPANFARQYGAQATDIEWRVKP